MTLAIATLLQQASVLINQRVCGPEQFFDTKQVEIEFVSIDEFSDALIGSSL